MRKYSLSLFFIFWCFIMLFAAEKTSIKGDTLKLEFISCQKHFIQIHLSPEKSRIYFIDEISVLKSELVKRKKYNFFLNKELTLDKVSVNGEIPYLIEYKNLKATDFSPRLRISTLAEVQKNSRILEIWGIKTETMPDTVKIVIKYFINTSKEKKLIFPDETTLEISGNTYWYPRNPYKDEHLVLQLKTLKVPDVRLSDTPVTMKISNGLREYSFDNIDYFENPYSLQISGIQLK